MHVDSFTVLMCC